MMNSNKGNFVELAKAKIQEKRNLVISKDSKEGIVLAQQVIIEEGTRKTAFFVKGTINVENKEKLIEVRDAINEAINALEDAEQ